MDELKALGFKNVTYLLHCGIYVLCWKGEVVYVGLSRNPLGRVGDHSSGKIFDAVYFVRCPAEELDQLEKMLIKKYQPKYNRDGISPFGFRGVPKDRVKEVVRNSFSLRHNGTFIAIRKNGGGVVVEGLKVEEVRRDDPAPGWEWASR